MTTEHQTTIRNALNGLLGMIPPFFKGKLLEQTNMAILIDRGLTDLNRFADAAEALAAKDWSQFVIPAEHTLMKAGDVTVSQIENAGTSEIDKLASYLTAWHPSAIEGSAVDTAIKVMDSYEKDISALRGVVQPAINNLAARATAIEDDAGAALRQFVGWLSTKEQTVKIGARYPVPDALALVDEYLALPKPKVPADEA